MMHGCYYRFRKAETFSETFSETLQAMDSKAFSRCDSQGFRKAETVSETFSEKFQPVSENTAIRRNTMNTTSDIARKLGCTPQAVNGYRRKAEAKAGKTLGAPHPDDGRRTVYSDKEVALIKEFAPRIPVTPAETEEWQEPEAIEVEVVSPTVTALGLRHPTAITTYTQSFDLESAQAEVAALQQMQAQRAGSADTMLASFAKAQMLGAVLEIQKSIETMKANALGDAASLLGKSQPQ